MRSVGGAGSCVRSSIGNCSGSSKLRLGVEYLVWATQLFGSGWNGIECWFGSPPAYPPTLKPLFIPKNHNPLIQATDLPTLHALPHQPHAQPTLQAQQPPKGQLRGQRKNHPSTGTHVPSVATHGPKISESYQAKFIHQKDLLRIPDHLKLTTLKSQNATSPADPEEAPSKPIPKPTPEQRSNTKGSSLELRQFLVFFSFSVPFFNSNPVLIFTQL
jgi:hypothetical protein